LGKWLGHEGSELNAACVRDQDFNIWNFFGGEVPSYPNHKRQGLPSIAQVGLELKNLLAQSLRCWDHRRVPLCMLFI
jgi:hypothetical protein